MDVLTGVTCAGTAAFFLPLSARTVTVQATFARDASPSLHNNTHEKMTNYHASLSKLAIRQIIVKYYLHVH